MNMYKFVVTDNKVICLSSYMGRTVRGVAKCAPGDEFNEEFGKKLAQARCDVKVARKRHERATQKYLEADELYCRAEDHLNQMDDYLWNAEKEMVAAEKTLGSLTEIFKK